MPCRKMHAIKHKSVLFRASFATSAFPERVLKAKRHAANVGPWQASSGQAWGCHSLHKLSIAHECHAGWKKPQSVVHVCVCVCVCVWTSWTSLMLATSPKQMHLSSRALLLLVVGAPFWRWICDKVQSSQHFATGHILVLGFPIADPTCSQFSAIPGN